jgi:hypothetical protein
MHRLSFALICLAFSAHAADCTLTGTVRVVGTTQPVSGAIVYLGAINGRASATTNVVLEVVDGVFQPHVQVAPRGGRLVLRNNDPTLHVAKVQVLSPTNAVTVWTQAMPYAGFEKAFALDGFREPTLLRISGGNGEEMSGYVAVMPHPWATLTDETGRFELRNVPISAHKIFVWHELLGTLTRELKLSASRTNAVELVFTKRDERRRSD